MPKIRKSNNLETTDDIETKITISKITNKLLNTDINGDKGKYGDSERINPEFRNTEFSSKGNSNV